MDRRFFAAVKALLFYEGKFLLVKRSSAARGEHQFWEFPGGRLEFGETPEEALLREVKEETGLQATLISPIQTWSFFRDTDTQIIGITFLANANEPCITLSSEHDAYAWVTKDEISHYHIHPSVLDGIQKFNFDELNDQCSRA